MVVINLTIELTDKEEVYQFENWLKQYVNIKDFRILPNTDELYDSDDHFKKLSKSLKQAKRDYNDYINKNR